MTDAIEAGARAKTIVTDEMVRAAILAENAECDADDMGPTKRSMSAALEAAIASGALVPASAVAEMRERCIQAVRNAKSLDENGYITEKSAAIEAIRQLDIAPASGDYVLDWRTDVDKPS